MKKTLLKSLALVAVGSLFLAGSAMALPTLNPGYSWNNSDYWTNTDGESNFTITVEKASYESDFGIYTVDNVSTPTKVTSEFQIFAGADEPITSKTVTFSYGGSGWQVSSDQTNWTPFDNVFGFYYHVINTDNTFYTDKQFNSVDPDIDHILTAYNSDNNKSVAIYLDDQAGFTRDRDYNDMTVFTNNLAPVPEPATMLLFGAGLAGIAGLRRKKSKKV